jgi:hypothetical protein
MEIMEIMEIETIYGSKRGIKMRKIPVASVSLLLLSALFSECRETPLRFWYFSHNIG